MSDRTKEVFDRLKKPGHDKVLVTEVVRFLMSSGADPEEVGRKCAPERISDAVLESFAFADDVADPVLYRKIFDKLVDGPRSRGI